MILIIFLFICLKKFCVLKSTISLRRFFWVPTSFGKELKNKQIRQQIDIPRQNYVRFFFHLDLVK